MAKSKSSTPLFEVIRAAQAKQAQQKQKAMEQAQRAEAQRAQAERAQALRAQSQRATVTSASDAPAIKTTASGLFSNLTGWAKNKLTESKKPAKSPNLPVMREVSDEFDADLPPAQDNYDAVVTKTVEEPAQPIIAAPVLSPKPVVAKTPDLSAAFTPAPLVDENPSLDVGLYGESISDHYQTAASSKDGKSSDAEFRLGYTALIVAGFAVVTTVLLAGAVSLFRSMAKTTGNDGALAGASTTKRPDVLNVQPDAGLASNNSTNNNPLPAAHHHPTCKPQRQRPWKC